MKSVTQYIENNGAPALLALCEQAARHHVNKLANVSLYYGKVKIGDTSPLQHLLDVCERLNPKSNGNHCQGEDFLLSARGGVPVRPCIGGVRSTQERAVIETQDALARAAWYFRADRETVATCHNAIQTLETL